MDIGLQTLNGGLLRKAAELSRQRTEKYDELQSRLKELHNEGSVRDLLSVIQEGKIEVYLERDSTTKGMVCIGKHPFKDDPSTSDVRTRFFILKETGEYEQTSPGTEKVRQWTECNCAEMLELLGVSDGSLARIKWVVDTVREGIEKKAQEIVDTISSPL